MSYGLEISKSAPGRISRIRSSAYIGLWLNIGDANESVDYNSAAYRVTDNAVTVATFFIPGGQLKAVGAGIHGIQILEGASKGVHLLEDVVKETHEVEEGIYVLRLRTGEAYVGQSGNFVQRFLQHLGKAKMDLAGATVERIVVKGGKEAREVAEHQMMKKLINDLGRDKVLNVRWPIGAKRIHLFSKFP